MQRAYLQSTRFLGILLAVVGVAMLVSTIARGGGALALGVIVGAAFIALGLGRVYLAGR